MAKILIVEDDPKIADYISTLLSGGGHRCLVTPSGARARDYLASEPDVDLLILDQHLETDGDTGVTLLTRLRATPKYQAVPVLICSGDSRPEVLKEFLLLRIAGFLKKPFKPERMLADVDRALSGGASSANDASPS